MIGPPMAQGGVNQRCGTLLDTTGSVQSEQIASPRLTYSYNLESGAGVTMGEPLARRCKKWDIVCTRAPRGCLCRWESEAAPRCRSTDFPGDIAPMMPN